MNMLLSLRLSAFVLIAGFLSTCGGSKQANLASSAEQGIRFDSLYFERELPGCKKEGERCARIVLDYPVAVGGAERVRSFVNDTIREHVWRNLAGLAFAADLKTLDPDTISRRFFGEYLDYAKALEEYNMAWEAETTGQVIYQSPRMVTVSLQNYSFLGGAHPTTFTELLNIDLRRLRVLKIENVVANTERLQRLAEARFREFHGLDKNADLNKEGFFWDKPFFLPEHFAVQKEGLLLFYNQYEAAAYAVGTTEIMIPWKELKGVLRKDFER